MLEFGPDTVVSGQLVDWGKIYIDMFAKIYSGAYTNENLNDVDYWWMLKQGACTLGGDFDTPINSKFDAELKAYTVDDPVLGEISIYDLVQVRLEQMKEETVLFDPFTGPIYDNEGNLMFEAGQRGSHDDLWSINWYVDNIVGAVPVL
jgi:simple sugar transport system substrate-binding protein